MIVTVLSSWALLGALRRSTYTCIHLRPLLSLNNPHHWEIFSEICKLVHHWTEKITEDYRRFNQSGYYPIQLHPPVTFQVINKNLLMAKAFKTTISHWFKFNLNNTDPWIPGSVFLTLWKPTRLGLLMRSTEAKRETAHSSNSLRHR